MKPNIYKHLYLPNIGSERKGCYHTPWPRVSDKSHQKNTIHGHLDFQQILDNFKKEEKLQVLGPQRFKASSVCDFHGCLRFCFGSSPSCTAEGLQRMLSALRSGSQFLSLLPISAPCFHLSRWILALHLLDSISPWGFCCISTS